MADAFTDPFKSAVFGDPFKSSPFKDPFGAPEIDKQTQELTELRELARLAGKKEEDRKGMVMNSIEKMGKILNYDVANITGFALGALRDDMSIAEGRRYGVERNTGWQDVFEEVVGKPTTKLGKSTMFGAGLVGDIFLSPLTYLSLGYTGYAKAVGGTSVKITGAANKLINKGSKEIVSHAESLVKEGMDPVAANKIAQFQAKTDLDNFAIRVLKADKGNLTASDFDDLIKAGLSANTVEHVMQLGGQIIDRGGIKMFGKTLVSSKALAKTPIGRAANRLGEFSVVKTAGNLFGRTFITDYLDNPQLVEIADKMKMKEKREFHNIIMEYNKIFKNLTNEEGVLFAETGHKKMKEVTAESDRLLNEFRDRFSAQFPDQAHMVSDRTKIEKLYNSIDDDAASRTTKLREAWEKITSPALDERRAKVLASGGYEVGTEKTQIDEMIFNIDSLKKAIRGTIDTSEREYKNKLTKASINKVPDEITEAERAFIAKEIDRADYEKLYDEWDREAKKLERIRDNATGTYVDKSGKVVGATHYNKLSDVEKALYREVDSSTPDFVAKLDKSKAKLAKADAGLLDAEKNLAKWRTKIDEYSSKKDPEKWAGKLKEARAKAHSAAGKLQKAKEEAEVASNKFDELSSIGKPRKADNIDRLAIIQRKMLKVQSDLSAKDELLKGMLSSRRIAKAAQKAQKVTFESPELQKIADLVWNNADNLTTRLGKLAGLPEEDMFKFYYPHEFEDKVMVNKFANARHMSVFSRAADNHLKAFQGADDYIKRPAEAYKKAALEAVSSKIKIEAIESIFSAFGKQADNMTAQEMKKLGFKELTREIQGKSYTGWVPEELHKQVNSMFDTKKSMVSEIAEFTGFDWATNLFKSWSTGLFPAFQVMNIVGNQFNIMLKVGMGAMDPRKQDLMLNIAVASLPPESLWKRGYMKVRNITHEQLDNVTFDTLDGKKIVMKDFIKDIKEHSDVLDSGIFDNFEQGIKEIGKTSNWNPASLDWTVMQQARQFGQSWEIQAKLLVIQDAVINGKTIKDGVKDAEEAIFNYQKLTPFEREYMKRIIPFYTYARKNAEFQATQLMKNPGRVATQFKLFNNANGSFGNEMETNDETGLPSYVTNRLGLRSNMGETNQQQVINGFGLPIEEFLGRFSGEKGFVWGTVSNLFAQANPLLKIPIERVTGVDVFRGKPIMELDNGETFSSYIDALGGPDKGVGKELAALLNYRELPNQKRYENGVVVGTYTKYYADPIALHWFRNLPSARLTNTVNRLSSNDITTEDKMIKFWTGLNRIPIDEGKQKWLKELQEKEELVTWLEKAGVIKSKEIWYEPKP